MEQQIPQETTGKTAEQIRSANIYSYGYFALTLVPLIVVTCGNSTSQTLTVILLLSPLIGLTLLYYGDGAIRLYAPKGSSYASAFGGLLCAVSALACQVLLNVETLPPYKLLIASVVAVVVIFIVLYFITIKKAKDKFFGIDNCVLLGFGSIAGINFGFDFSKEKLYPATVVGQYTTQGKSTYYHLTISAWGTEPSPVNITVSMSTYNATRIGSKATVHLKQGALNSPWFYVTE